MHKVGHEQSSSRHGRVTDSFYMMGMPTLQPESSSSPLMHLSLRYSGVEPDELVVSVLGRPANDRSYGADPSPALVALPNP
jgi:hypothetical protein